jgi:hypothetical protein
MGRSRDDGSPAAERDDETNPRDRLLGGDAACAATASEADIVVVGVDGDAGRAALRGDVWARASCDVLFVH